MSKVILKKIAKVYPNGFKAVKDIDLEIQDGEFMVFVGPSGCAKSTTLRMIAGLEDISGGELYIGERLVNDLEPNERNIAMVFQDYALYPHMTVYENMAYGLRIRKFSEEEIDRRVKHAAEILGLTANLYKKPKAMSGGQRQRVAVGRTIVREPEVFLFDEPLSNLDAKLRVHMRAEIVKIQKSLNTTMVYVTHDQVEAMTMGDRICVLNAGQIMQVDEPLRLYENPANKFVATFIGSPAMNIIRGTIEKKDGKFFFCVQENSFLIPDGLSEKLTSYCGKEVDFGIRPEHIGSKNEKQGSENTLSGKVTIIELMGNEIVVHFDALEKTVVARLNPHEKISRGAAHEFVFDMNFAQFFDTETEKNIIL